MIKLIAVYSCPRCGYGVGFGLSHPEATCPRCVSSHVKDFRFVERRIVKSDTNTKNNEGAQSPR